MTQRPTLGRTFVILVAVLLLSFAHSAFAQDPLDRALLLYERRDFEGAMQESNRVIQSIPNYSRAYTVRGQIKRERNDFDGAMADFNKALELNPKEGLASYQRGVIRFQRGDNEGAISDFDKTIEFAAKVPMVHYNRGLAKQALAINPRDYDCYLYRAQARERKQELESAADDYGKAIELNPQSAEAYAGRGIVRLSQKKDAETQADFDQSLKLKYHRDKK